MSKLYQTRMMRLLSGPLAKLSKSPRCAAGPFRQEVKGFAREQAYGILAEGFYVAKGSRVGVRKLYPCSFALNKSFESLQFLVFREYSQELKYRSGLQPRASKV